ncbi:ATP-dependent helicase HrpA [Thioalkalivibrio sp. K90mix]|uniref:ATP-dependent RNA helicase HrpA n=1 Tax=Thioalkalivibrio sp. (strain K90mix) TaxID=396595 RepID=UPI000195AAF0|nr:ATP-dependent RNA helicase HrpA [Thioalkalivibrio sp. K90mix]ADC70760.1 ATP-dependent helicase HrpA [Thioalkalivibrio sp. K90mix]
MAAAGPDLDALARTVEALPQGRERRELGELLRRARQRHKRGQPCDRLVSTLTERLARAEQGGAERQHLRPQPTYAGDLPIHAERERIVAAIREHPVLVLCGETGSGKTTQLPKLCLEAGRGETGLIGHTQPRRIAARSVASRIAEELGTTLGGDRNSTVGFKVRFSDQTGPNNWVKLMTDGMLLAELAHDPELRAYDTLIVDEAHERSLNIDFLMGVLKRLSKKRPELRIIITSATLDPERLSAFFDDAPILTVAGRTYPVELRYRPIEPEDADEDNSTERGERDLFDGIRDAVAECERAGPGDILVFLPGEREIRDAHKALRGQVRADTEVLALYARLSAREQARVFQSHSGRRIVLATNVAETALTVPGIRFVIDSGLARISRYSWRSRVQRLSLEPISQAACDQRAGRCGRLGPGICIRLFSEDDYNLRPPFTDPEIQRSNLASVILQMAALKLGQPRQFPFVDPPDPRLVKDGYRLLEELGAVDTRGRTTPRGRQLARMPIDPRHGAMLLAGADHGCVTETATIAAFLSLQDPRERPAEATQAADQAHREFQVEGSDFMGMLRLWEAWHTAREDLGSNALKRWCREHFLNFLRMREWQELRVQLLRLAREMDLKPNHQPADAEPVHRALLTGLVSQIGQKTERGDYLGARNRRFQIHPGSVLAKKKPAWVMSAEIAETTRVYARDNARIEPDWILAAAPHLLKHHIFEPHFQRRSGRVGAFDRITLYGLVVAPKKPVDFAKHDPSEARRILIREGLVGGELRTRSKGVQANREAVAEIAEQEARGRRRDLLVEEDRLFDFYDARLPADITDGTSFETWARKAEKQDPDALRIDRAELLNEPDATLPQGAYPDHLELEGLRLPLAYRFEPGQPDDGVTVTIPIAALNAVPDWLGDWLVPGLLEERVTGLLKSLPKGLRRQFVPAPDFAAAALARIEHRQGPLIPALAEALRAMTGTEIPLDAWRPETLEPHLVMRFRILDPEGQEQASGRNLAALKRRLGGSAEAHFDASRPDEITREGITEWDFGALPESVEFDHQGAQLRAFPILVDRGDAVSLELEPDPAKAERAHRAGLRRLFLLSARKTARDLRRQLPEIERACLNYSTLGSCEALRDQILEAAADRVFLAEPWPRDAEAFRERLEARLPEFSPTVMELSRLAAEILRHWHDLRTRLQGDLPLSWIEAARDIRGQLEALVPADFLLRTPHDVLPELPRYLQAIDKRLERLTQAPDKDRARRVAVEPLWQQAQELIARAPDHPDVLAFRYRIEEFRVSQFAQELGTREKVSPKRLEREYADVIQRLASGT